jgi:hypothetical protein
MARLGGLVLLAVAGGLGDAFLAAECHAQAEGMRSLPGSLWQSAIEGFFEHFGALLIAAIAGGLAYIELRAHRRSGEKKLQLEEKTAAKMLELEERRYNAEEAEREKLVRFREQEYRRFSEPSAELAEHVAQQLVANPTWAHRALEAAKLLPYTNTLFGERSQHFRAEKEVLAAQFTPYLLRRCESLAADTRHVVLLVDAGTTLYPFFELLGKETMERWQKGAKWLERFHLATNNLPGLEQLIKTGRRAPWDRYSKLAIENCYLLPGVPMPIFAAVAGEDTNEAIRKLKARHIQTEGAAEVTFVALVVGNWVRIRGTVPRCPVPMARGAEHLAVKQTLVENADEVFVVSPLGKVFVGYSNEDINRALGFTSGHRDLEKASYEEVQIGENARRVKLVGTTRAEGRLLHRHSNRTEDALTIGVSERVPTIDAFAEAKIEEVPHLLFPFGTLPHSRVEEFLVEFPHDHTRHSRQILEMFSVDPALIS